MELWCSKGRFYSLFSQCGDDGYHLSVINEFFFILDAESSDIKEIKVKKGINVRGQNETNQVFSMIIILEKFFLLSVCKSNLNSDQID